VILAKLGTHDLYAQKCGTDFKNFDLNIFGNFFKILNLDLKSGTATVELFKPAGLYSFF